MKTKSDQVKALEELAEFHQKKLLEMGRRIVPTLTPEDVLQPNDYPILDAHPEFRYQEGVLAGVLEALSSIRRCESES